jgi:hypothetical protein
LLHEHLYNIYVEIKHYNSLSPITLEWKIEITPKSIQTVRLSIPITMRSLKWVSCAFGAAVYFFMQLTTPIWTTQIFF